MQMQVLSFKRPKVLGVKNGFPLALQQTHRPVTDSS